MKHALHRTTLIFAIILTGAGFASGQGLSVVTPSEFEQLSTGKTLYFSRDGHFFGAEQYYTRRRSLWVNELGECANGEWYAKEDLICFVYDTNPNPQCWHFLKKSGGYVARAEGSTEDFDLLMDGIDTKPLDCKGPGLGV